MIVISLLQFILFSLTGIIQSPRSANVTLEKGESGFLSFLVNNSGVTASVRIKITKFFRNGSSISDSNFQWLADDTNGVLRWNNTNGSDYTASLWPSSDGSGALREEYVIRVLHGENFACIERMHMQLQIRDDRDHILPPTRIDYHVLFSEPTPPTSDSVMPSSASMSIMSSEISPISSPTGGPPSFTSSSRSMLIAAPTTVVVLVVLALAVVAIIIIRVNKWLKGNTTIAPENCKNK